ncbi:MAG TPA: NAD(P)/FAD-dependent oxidoreductase [Polyangiaceae bacterium]
MEPAEHIDVVVIGGGVIGVAVARALARSGRDVILVEAEGAFGTHTSSRNSEVIHAGIYYPTGSLKATLCVSGKASLYDYCRTHDVPHRRIGKLIVATTEEQVAGLVQLRVQAAQNGVADLEWLDAADIQRLEPNVVAHAGLLSPSTGIVDSHALLSRFRYDAEALGVIAVTSSPVLCGAVTDAGISLSVGGPEPMLLHCRAVVNAAGLYASRVAHSIEGVPASAIPPAFFAKGHYFTLAGPAPFNRLVYPVPEPGGLGVHVTLDMAGSVRFGPDVSWLDTVDYSFDLTRAERFYSAIRTYFPGLPAGSLMPGYTGIRPKIVDQGNPSADFVVQGPETHGLPLVNLFGIESPGLTASLALADRVCELLAPTNG